MTQWQQIQGSTGWTQWADPQQADELIAVAADWVSPQAIANATDPISQRLLVRGALAALGSAFQSLNLPPLAWPWYRVLYNQFYGDVAAVDIDDAAASRQRSQYLGGGSVGAQLVPTLQTTDQAGAIAQCAITADVTLVLDHLDENGNVYQEKSFLPEYGTNSLQTLWTWNTLTNTRDPIATPPNFTAQGLAPFLGHQTTLDWGTIAWQSGPNTNLNIGTPAVQQGPQPACGINVFLYPYIWQTQFVQAVVNAWQSVGAAQVLEDSRNYAMVLNAYNAAVLGLTSGDYAQVSLAAAPLLENWLNNPDNPARAQMRSQAESIGATAITSLAVTAAVPYGWVYSVILGVIAIAEFALSYVIPVAVGYSIDPFGRMMPDPTKRTTSAWQPAQLVFNQNGSAPTDDQLKVPSPADLAPPGVTEPNPQAPATQAPPPPAFANGVSPGRLIPKGRSAMVLGLPGTVTHVLEGTNGSPTTIQTEPYTGTIPTQGVATTPVASSPQNSSGQYVAPDGSGTVIGTPTGQTSSGATTAPASTASTLSTALSNPVIVTGTAAGIAAVGWALDRLRK